ncbi:hypothetical protein V9664_09555 [Streptococcus suis]|uniref:hypothetical protein n=1 Tax=Streptococcus suis TaxID=1307 RepID=UPI00300FA4AD
MTKLIGFGRCLGKTTMAILESHATGHYIVCANRRMADDTFRFAKQLGYTIPFPLSVSDTRFRFPDGRKYSDEPVIIDNVEMVLQSLLGCQIETITFNSPNVITTYDRYVQEIAELKKELAACYREKEEDQAIIETLKDKCVDLMLENADYVWDEMARETAKKRANKRKWNSK